MTFLDFTGHSLPKMELLSQYIKIRPLCRRSNPIFDKHFIVMDTELFKNNTDKYGAINLKI